MPFLQDRDKASILGVSLGCVLKFQLKFIFLVLSFRFESRINSHYFIFEFYPTGSQNADGEDKGPAIRTPIATGHRAPGSMPYEGFSVYHRGDILLEAELVAC